MGKTTQTSQTTHQPTKQPNRVLLPTVCPPKGRKVRAIETLRYGSQRRITQNVCGADFEEVACDSMSGSFGNCWYGGQADGMKGDAGNVMQVPLSLPFENVPSRRLSHKSVSSLPKEAGYKAQIGAPA